MSDDAAEELRKLAADFESAPAEAKPRIKKAVGISALKGKRAWQSAVSGRSYLGAYVPSIDYDPVDANLSTDLGPNLNRRGAGGLGIVEDSPGGVRGTPQRNYLQAEAVAGPDLEAGVQLAIDQTLRELGL
ncbi:hypothetical protein [Microbacterium sp.]|uniref:hypothetical protein n=1 Tax=Microbacterium sp. TaxID=51671 RepID=UPI003242F7E6